jgi:hypothetical protein
VNRLCVPHTLRVFDHVDLNASDYTASVGFYETVLSPLGIPKLAEHEQRTGSSARRLRFGGAQAVEPR